MKTTAHFFIALFLSIGACNIQAGTDKLTQEDWSLINELGLTKETERILELQEKYKNTYLLQSAEKEYMNTFLIRYSTKNIHNSNKKSSIGISIIKSILSKFSFRQMVTNLKSRL